MKWDLTCPLLPNSTWTTFVVFGKTPVFAKREDTFIYPV